MSLPHSVFGGLSSWWRTGIPQTILFSLFEWCLQRKYLIKFCFPEFALLLLTGITLLSNAEAGIGLICACLPVISSYYAYRKKSRNQPPGSNSYELSSWREISESSKSKFAGRDRDFPNLSQDQAELICTIEGGAEPELGKGESTTTLPSQETK